MKVFMISWRETKFYTTSIIILSEDHFPKSYPKELFQPPTIALRNLGPKVTFLSSMRPLCLLKKLALAIASYKRMNISGKVGRDSRDIQAERGGVRRRLT